MKTPTRSSESTTQILNAGVPWVWFRTGLILTLTLLTILPAVATVLDDFNAAQRTGWTDANPANQPLPGGQQANGVFTFDLPMIGQSYFVSSTKTSPTFELKEGRTIEFRVDMISGRGPDSFAVLGFMPVASGPNALAGYGLAKSETDVIISKGIQKYFIDDDETPVKNENITLVLNLSAKSGSVHITGQILDKDANNAVIWERKFIDTPAADVLGTGEDSPPAPYITTGNFVLYLYGDEGEDPAGYQVVLDNAMYYITDTEVIDDFNAASRSNWQDSNPANQPLPGGQQADGVFTFNLPMIGQAYFIASTKTSKTYSLTEGTRHEFSVDMVSGQGGDSYAVLAFIPTATGANTLAGYGIVKSETDTIISKGIQKYFIDDDDTLVKNNNVTLVLTLTVENGSVIIRGRVLDKDNNNEVIWERTFIDTPGADVLGTGTDENPSTPFIGMNGNLVLYLYGDEGTDPAGYSVVYDNLIAAAPPGATNQPPIISGVSPIQGAAFMSSPVTISFNVLDDKPLPDTGISVDLNGNMFTTANGLVLSGQPTNRTATLSVGTGPNTNYVAALLVKDSDNTSVTNLLYFDSFIASNPLLEAEDYNFNSGQYINNPIANPEHVPSEDSYVEQVGTEGVDFHDTRTSPNFEDTMYRSFDPIRMQRTIDLDRPKYDANQGIYGYDIGDIAANEWMNYTRDFANGTYEVYLREAIIGYPLAESILEMVTSDTTQPEQTVNPLGSFLGRTSGFTFRNVPLTDGTGMNKVLLRLSGKTTLRLRQVTPDVESSYRFLNYLVFVPVAEAGVQRALITSLQPAPDSSVQSVDPVIQVTIQNRDTDVNIATINLAVNGQQVAANVSSNASGATVTYALAPLPPPNSTVNALISFKDSEGVDVSTAWQFAMAYRNVDPALRVPGSGNERGFNLRVVQAELGQQTDNDLSFAEGLLRPGQTNYVEYFDTNVVGQLINFSQDGPGTSQGSFPDDELIPGLDGYSTDDIAMEATAYLELAAGKHRFGVNSDDGYKVQVVPNFNARDTAPLAFHNGGPANETFDFYVSQAGLYPFRLVWYERGGGAHVEFFQGNFTNGDRILLNSTGAVKAFTSVTTPPQFTSATVSNGQLTISWTGAGVLQETTDFSTWTDVPGQPSGTYTVSVGTTPGGKFYRLRP